MKKFHALSLFFFLILGLGNISAQNVIEEGKVKMEIIKIESDNPMLAMMQGSTVNLSFNKTKSLLKMNMMNGMMQVTNFNDKVSKTATIMMNGMGMKMMTETSSELAEDKKPKVEVTYDKTDTKKILDYNCYKANIKITNGENVNEMTAYVTKDLKLNAEILKQQGVDASMLEGVPLEYAVTTAQQGMKFTMIFQVKEIEKTLGEKAFEINTEGYKKVSIEEFGKMGGMGF